MPMKDRVKLSCLEDLNDRASGSEDTHRHERGYRSGPATHAPEYTATKLWSKTWECKWLVISDCVGTTPESGTGRL